VRWRIQRLLQSVSSHQRRGTIALVEVAHLLRDLDPCVRRVQLLLGTCAVEKAAHLINCDRLLCLWVQHRERLVLHIRYDVIPFPWYLILLQKESFLFFHFIMLLKILFPKSKRKTANLGGLRFHYLV